MEVATVAIKAAAGAAAVAAAGNCGWTVPAACTPELGESVAECPVAASAECPWAATAAAIVEEELAGASTFAASAGPLPGLCLSARDAGTVVADGLASAAMVSEWSDAGVAAWVATGAFGGAAFGGTGAGAATAAGMAAMVAGSAPVCGLVGPVVGLGVVAAGWSLVFAGVPTVAVVVVASTADATDTTAVVAAALVAISAGAGAVATDPDVTDWLAAIAAAAIASGAVVGPDVAGAVGAAGTGVKATGTGMATATAFGVGISVAFGEVPALAESAAAEASEDDEVAVDFAPSAGAPSDFPRGCDGASVGAPAPAAEGGAALPSWLVLAESMLAGWPAGAVSRDRLLSGAVELLLSDPRDGVDWSWVWVAAGLASVAALLSIRDAKTALPCDGSENDLVGRCDGP
jgi:hypothetical protein